MRDGSTCTDCSTDAGFRPRRRVAVGFGRLRARRTLTPCGRAAPRPVEEPLRERTYGEEEVAAILRRAAQLERDRGTTEGALSLREIEAIARDSGIDLALVRQAARELDEGRAKGIAAAIAGAPLRRVIERVVDGEIGAEHHERLAQEIRDVLSSAVGREPLGAPGQHLHASGGASPCPASPARARSR